MEMYKWHKKDFTALFVDLVQRLPKLIALLVVLPGAPKAHCIAATRILENVVRLERPCFCVQITDSLNSSYPANLPMGQYEVLVRDPPPLVGALPFHMVSQEPRC